jgi:hypothetical protein
MRSAVAARQSTFRGPIHNTLPRAISLSGPQSDPGSEREVLPNFVKIGTNLSKQSSDEIEVEERFVPTVGHYWQTVGWVGFGSLVARGAWLAKRLELLQGSANLVIAVLD